MSNCKTCIHEESCAAWIRHGEILYDDFEYSVDNCPYYTGKAVRGRWVNPYINRYGHPCHCCSICGFKASYQDKNYCPNCGAKMDGGK